MNGPNLSQYFANDPPSMFDEIATNTFGNVFRGPNTDDALDPPPDLLSSASKCVPNEISVPDDVRDMWKPSSVEQGVPPLLTMPGVQLYADLNDPIREAVMYLLGETEASQRKILTADDVTQDERGIRQLIESGYFRSAVNLTNRCLTIYGQGFGRAGQPTKHSTHSLQLWFTRLALLLKIGETALAQQEAEAFGLLDRPDIYFEFYREMHNGRKGSMASFSFRLLIAKLPAYSGSLKTALDRLTDMSITCNAIKEHYASATNRTAQVFWEQREHVVVCALINCSLAMRDFSLADYLMEKLTTQPSLDTNARRAFYSAWGRIYLQCGDVFGAERKFSEARRIRETSATHTDTRDFVDKGLIAVAQNDFKEAFIFFQKAHDMDRTSTLVLNNMGVCLLYSGKLKEAISMFEQAIGANTQTSLNKSILLNLCTLYELESSNDVSKKLALLKQINRYKADLNIDIEKCLKLPTGNRL